MIVQKNSSFKCIQILEAKVKVRMHTCTYSKKPTKVQMNQGEKLLTKMLKYNKTPVTCGQDDYDVL